MSGKDTYYQIIKDKIGDKRLTIEIQPQPPRKIRLFFEISK